MYENNFLDRMALGKAAAERERSKDRGFGAGTVRVFETTEGMHRARRGNDDPSAWDTALIEARARWQSTATQAIEDLVFALYGDQWEGFEL